MFDNSKTLNIKNYGKNYGVTVGENYGNINNYHSEPSKKEALISICLRDIVEHVDLTQTEKDQVKLGIYDISKKVIYNQIIKYKKIFDKYKIYHEMCEKYLNKQDDLNAGQSKLKILYSIEDAYSEVLGDYRIKIAREYPTLSEEEWTNKILEDRIADEIVDKIKGRIKQCLSNEITEEDKNIGLNIILCYAFIECKILEKPKENEVKTGDDS